MRTSILICVLGALFASGLRAEVTPFAPTRADQQQLQADVLLYFDGPDKVKIERPENYLGAFPLSSLEKYLRMVTDKREMIVVIMGVDTQVWPKDKFKSTVDDLEARLRKFDFKKVIFHLASSSFITPIFRE